ncbi:MAG: gamma-glutamyltransferase [Verrucomicrobiales bacterium]|nr:gamma-glutamyltransferase [Verrucomicrobiales bacterium]
MNSRCIRLRRAVCWFVLLNLACPAIRAGNGAVATVHGEATAAGVAVLREGGNAVDAAIAAALTLGVVDGQNSGIGGGCLAIVRLANGKVVAVDGRETAPRAATRDMFVRAGQVVPALSQEGPLAVGVPGELAALEWLARRYGCLPMARHLARAADLAERGFPISRSYANRLLGEVPSIRRHAEAARILLHEDGRPWAEGELLRQPDLASTYRAIAANGTRWFYRGPFADRTERWMRDNGGLLRRRDFAHYRPVQRETVVSRYREATVIGFPPPSSGGVHVAQILNILDHFDLRALGEDSPAWVHWTAEAMRLAFADRAFWLGDSDFVRVPRGLADPKYAARLAARIHPESVAPVDRHDNPPDADREFFGKHTTHLSAMDGEGNWVTLTATINTTFGSKVVIPGTGVFLNNQMDDFSAQPGATNFFGLVGSEANAVAPGKRPLSSMSPTLVLRDGQPVLAVGAAGGPTIISQVVLAIIRFVDFQKTPAEAIAGPRFHHQWLPDELVLESAWDASTEAALKGLGHKVRRVRTLGAAQATGRWLDKDAAAGDPRVDGVGTVVE